MKYFSPQKCKKRKGSVHILRNHVSGGGKGKNGKEKKKTIMDIVANGLLPISAQLQHCHSCQLYLES